MAIFLIYALSNPIALFAASVPLALASPRFLLKVAAVEMAAIALRLQSSFLPAAVARH